MKKYKLPILYILVCLVVSLFGINVISADEPGEIEIKTRYSCPLGRNEHSWYEVTDVFLPAGWTLDNYWIEESPRGWETCGAAHPGSGGNPEYQCLIYRVYDPLLGGYEDAPYGDYQDRCKSIETLNIEHVYYANGAGADNMWEIHHPENPFKGYCFSHHTGAPGGTYDRVEGTDANFVQGGIIDNISTALTEPASSRRSFAEAFKTALYFGYPNNGGGIKERYNLTDVEFTIITHNVIWHYSNGHDYDSLVEQVAKMCQEGYFGGVTGTWDYRVLNAFNELYYKTYEDIPQNVRDTMKLYVYISRDGAQNLMSMESLQYDERGGVAAYKVDNNNNPVSGATFGIYNTSNQLVGQVTSEAHGVATYCKADRFDGLPLGTYTIRELTAPNGYTKSDDYYTFTISQQNEIATMGKKNGAGDLTLIKFINNANSSTINNYGGLKIKKSDRQGNPLGGAIYGVYNSSGNKILELITNNKGEAETSKTALAAGNYTLREIKSPDGYIKDDTPHSFSISGNQQFTSILNLVNDVQEIFVDVKAKKQLLKTDSQGQDVILDLDKQYDFELYHVDGRDLTTGEQKLTYIASAKSDLDGNIIFENVKQLQQGIDTFIIKEKIPTSCTDIIYDEEGKIVEIMNIEGQGFVMYENVGEGGLPIFKNYKRIQKAQTSFIDTDDNDFVLGTRAVFEGVSKEPMLDDGWEETGPVSLKYYTDRGYVLNENPFENPENFDDVCDNIQDVYVKLKHGKTTVDKTTFEDEKCLNNTCTTKMKSCLLP